MLNFTKILTTPKSLMPQIPSLVRHWSTLNPSAAASHGSKDDYFAAIHHISNIVRRDVFMERTLNKLRIANLNSELVYRVLRACCNFGTEAFRFFHWARSNHPTYQPTTLEFEEVVKIQAKSKRFESMWKLLHEMKSLSLRISPETVAFVIEQYGKHGFIDHAVTVFNECSKSISCPQTLLIYNALLSALCDVKMFHGAYALVRRMIRKGVAPDKKTYGILVNGWCSNGKMREAQEFLEEMSRKGFNPPVRGRDILVEGLLNAGYLEAAKNMVRKMTKEGTVPDVSTFNSLITVICDSGEVDFCINMYHEVCGLGFSPDINTYKILIPAVSKAGRIEEAFGLLNCSVDLGHKPFPSLYGPIIKGMCKRGQFDDAVCFFSDMKARGHPPNRPVYTMLITLFVRGGRPIDAANYLIEMCNSGFPPMARCFDLVTDGLRNCGRHDLAKEIESLEVSV